MVIAFGLLLTVLVVLYVGQPLFVREPATANGDVLEAAIAARRRLPGADHFRGGICRNLPRRGGRGEEGRPLSPRHPGARRRYGAGLLPGAAVDAWAGSGNYRRPVPHTDTRDTDRALFDDRYEALCNGLAPIAAAITTAIEEQRRAEEERASREILAPSTGRSRRRSSVSPPRSMTGSKSPTGGRRQDGLPPAHAGAAVGSDRQWKSRQVKPLTRRHGSGSSSIFRGHFSAS